MTEEVTTPKRPKRLVAFVLNLVVPPAGYVYAGMPWVGMMCSFALTACGLWAMVLNSRDENFHPAAPDLGTLLITVFGLLLAGLFTGLHAAIRRRSRGVTGVRLWLIAAVLYALPLAAWFASRILG